MMRVLFSVSLVPLNSSVEKYGKANNGGYFENAHVFLREKVPFFVQSRSMKLTPNEYEIFKLFFYGQLLWTIQVPLGVKDTRCIIKFLRFCI